jgi:hypothetical protein
MSLHRLQFDVSDETLKEIDQVREMTGFSTRAELIRNALRFLQWIIQEMQGNAEFLVERGGQQQRVVFPFLRPAAKQSVEAFSRGTEKSGAAD